MNVTSDTSESLHVCTMSGIVNGMCLGISDIAGDVLTDGLLMKGFESPRAGVNTITCCATLWCSCTDIHTVKNGFPSEGNMNDTNGLNEYSIQKSSIVVVFFAWKEPL